VPLRRPCRLHIPGLQLSCAPRRGRCRRGLKGGADRMASISPANMRGGCVVAQAGGGAAVESGSARAHTTGVPAPGANGSSVSHPATLATATSAVCQVETASTVACGAASCVADGLRLLRAALQDTRPGARCFGSGLLRLEVALPRGVVPLTWLRHLPQEVRGVERRQRLLVVALQLTHSPSTPLLPTSADRHPSGGVLCTPGATTPTRRCPRWRVPGRAARVRARGHMQRGNRRGGGCPPVAGCARHRIRSRRGRPGAALRLHRGTPHAGPGRREVRRIWCGCHPGRGVDAIRVLPVPGAAAGAHR
jgi:hypothetical protein